MSNRGAEYKELKQAFLDSILEVVMDVFPQITREKVTFVPMQYGRRRLAWRGVAWRDPLLSGLHRSSTSMQGPPSQTRTTSERPKGRSTAPTTASPGSAPS